MRPAKLRDSEAPLTDLEMMILSAMAKPLFRDVKVAPLGRVGRYRCTKFERNLPSRSRDVEATPRACARASWTQTDLCTAPCQTVPNGVPNLSTSCPATLEMW